MRWHASSQMMEQSLAEHAAIGAGIRSPQWPRARAGSSCKTMMGGHDGLRILMHPPGVQGTFETEIFF